METRKWFRFQWAMLVYFTMLSLLLLPGCAVPSRQPEEPVRLTFLYEENSADYPALAQAFQQLHADIHINLVSYANSETLIRNSQLLAEADAVRLYAGTLSYLLNDQQDAFLVLDEFLATDNTFPQSSLFPKTLEALRLDGKQRAIPAGLNPYVIYALADAFTVHGIEPPKAGWTLQEFVQTANRIHNTGAPPDSDAFTYGFCSHPRYFDPVLFLYVFGGGLTDSLDQPTRATINQSANIEAVQWYRNLYQGLNLQEAVGSPEVLPRVIASGKCGLWVDVLSRSIHGTYGKNQAVPLPLPVHQMPIAVIEMDAYAIRASAAHPQEAWQWLQFLLMHEQAAGKLIPPLRSQVDSDRYEAQVAPQVLQIARSLPEQMVVHSLEYGQDRRFLQAAQPFLEALDSILKDEAGVQAALDLAQEKAIPAYK